MAADKVDCRIAYVVTPHGFGHASRACAVMAALKLRHPGMHFDVFTRVPEWFFENALRGGFTYHDLLTDVGLAQQTALREDIPETLRRLGQLLPFDRSLIVQLAQQMRQDGCRLVICDIAPMGIAAAREAGIPSLLVENFTWDYIYEGYVAGDSRLRWYIDHLREIFALVDGRIQTEPVAHRAPCDLTTAPVSRSGRTSSGDIRRELGIPEDARIVLVTMGGFSWKYQFLDLLGSRPDVWFIVPGAGDVRSGRAASGALPRNLVALPHHSPYFHPDLVNASDVVIGKAGYSTVAEVYWSGAAFGYVSRPQFRESESLVEFVAREMHGLDISEAGFEDGEWMSLLPDLLAMPRTSRNGENGAHQVAGFVEEMLQLTSW